MKRPKSKRARRVGVEIQKIISEELRHEMAARFPGVVVTVPEVRVSDDLSVAEVYYSVLGAEDGDQVAKAVKKGTPRLRKAAADALHIKKIPEFRFVWDDTMERADRIERLLNELDDPSSPAGPQEGDVDDS